jgi:hypothetical protein
MHSDLDSQEIFFSGTMYTMHVFVMVTPTVARPPTVTLRQSWDGIAPT